MFLLKKLMDNVKLSSQRYKVYLEEQRKSKKKTEQSNKLLDLDDEYKHEIIRGSYY